MVPEVFFFERTVILSELLGTWLPKFTRVPVICALGCEEFHCSLSTWLRRICSLLGVLESWSQVSHSRLSCIACCLGLHTWRNVGQRRCRDLGGFRTN